MTSRLHDVSSISWTSAYPTRDPAQHRQGANRPLAGCYWRYRVGDYRVVCDMQDHALRVLVIEAGNRRDVYR